MMVVDFGRDAVVERYDIKGGSSVLDVGSRRFFDSDLLDLNSIL